MWGGRKMSCQFPYHSTYSPQEYFPRKRRRASNFHDFIYKQDNTEKIYITTKTRHLWRFKLSSYYCAITVPSQNGRFRSKTQVQSTTDLVFRPNMAKWWLLNKRVKVPTSFTISVSPHVSARLPLDGFPRNLTLGTCTKMCSENQILFNMWHE